MTAQVTMLADEEMLAASRSRSNKLTNWPNQEEGFLAGARFARDRYEAREKLWREYRDLLLEEVNAHVGLAVAHGWAGSPERYARGKTLRAALGIDKERA